MNVWKLARHSALILVVLGVILVPNLAQDGSAYPSRVRWGYYVNWDSTSLDTLKAQVQNLDIVSPYQYQIRADGTIKTFPDQEAMQVMRDADVQIVPLVSNIPRWDDFTELMKNEERQNQIIDRLVNLVEENDFAGIHIDFEAINASDADLLTEFMRKLSERLWANNRLVSQAVIARVSDTSSVWGGAYDYEALASYNDFIVIMAYDDTPIGSATPGPVARAPWVRDVAAYAQSKIPNEKILLGVPFYGYDWTVNAQGIAEENAQAMRFDHTMALQQYDDVEYHWDETSRSPWATYTDDQGQKHEVWFENSESLRHKLDIMTDYGLGGIAAWRLGQEDPGVWDEISTLSTPASRVTPVESTDTRWYFDETGHTLSNGFLSYWLQNGELPVFGFPQTEEFRELNADTGREHTVQYFERQRYEYHEEYAGTPYAVLLGRLGHEDAVRRGLIDSQPFQPVEESDQDDCLYFEVTGQNACGPFLDYWESHGLNFGDEGISYQESLALFGYPISSEFTDPETGATVQYFERARFEYHPENAGTEYEVLLGLLGNEELRVEGWIR